MRGLTFLENITLARKFVFEFNDLKAFQYKSEEEIRRYQFQKIKELISLAYNHTKFYHNKYSKLDIHPEDIKSWADFKNMPTVTKDEIIRNREDCIVDSMKGRRDLIISRSSGSSGKVLDITLDAEFFIKKALVSHRFYDGIMNLHLNDKQVLIYTSEYPYNSLMGFFQAKYIHSLESSSRIFEFLNEEKPALVAAYPSVLIDLINKYGNSLKELNIQAICTHSEHSTYEERKYISDMFGCKVYDEYSTEELSKCAYECVNYTYHIQEDSAYLEILDENSNNELNFGETGEIVGTSLHNYVMPFIRYKQGDLGSIKHSNCKCGRTFRTLANIAGRKNDSFKLKNGKEIASGIILDWTYKLILDLKVPIQQFQVIQKEIDLVQIILIPGEGYNNDLHDPVIKSSFKKEFGSEFKIDIDKVNYIPRSRAGKHNAIRSLVR